jgi:hypothetical protein
MEAGDFAEALALKHHALEYPENEGWIFHRLLAAPNELLAVIEQRDLQADCSLRGPVYISTRKGPVLLVGTEFVPRNVSASSVIICKILWRGGHECKQVEHILLCNVVPNKIFHIR